MRNLLLMIVLHFLAFKISAQCIYSPVAASAYFQHNCGDKSLQNLVGVVLPIYGNNGIQYFTSPLTDHVIFSSTEETKTNQLRIFPSPAFDLVNIEWPYIEDAKVLFYSQLGQLITATQIESQSLSTIDINHLLPGYYIVKAITPTNQIFISKLIKQ